MFNIKFLLIFRFYLGAQTLAFEILCSIALTFQVNCQWHFLVDSRQWSTYIALSYFHALSCCDHALRSLSFTLHSFSHCFIFVKKTHLFLTKLLWERQQSLDPSGSGQGRPQQCSSGGANNCKYLPKYLWEDLSLHLSSTHTL
jgi:hypothetical protein